MSTEQEREGFEKWWEDEDLDKKLSNIQGVMFNRIKKLASNAWTEAWDQSRKGLVVELPPIDKYYAGIAAGTKVYAIQSFESDVKSEMRSAGITVKE